MFNSLFSDYEITEKSFIVNMTFNFIRIYYEYAKNQKRGSLPNQKDALAVKKKKYIMDVLDQLIRF